MTSQSIQAMEQAVQVAAKAVKISETTGDRVQLANACANLAKACVLTKDIARAYNAAIRAGKLFGELMGPNNKNTRSILALAEKLKQRIDSDYSQGIDWRRAITCPICGDRFPWSLQFDSAFEAGVDFVKTKCHSCNNEFSIDSPKKTEVEN